MKRSAEERQSMVARYIAGESMPAIALSTGSYENFVRRELKKAGVKSRTKRDANLGKIKTEDHKRKLSISCAALGQAHPKYKDGKWKERASERSLAMNGFEYKQWRSAVFWRYGYACTMCGIRDSHKVQADHIKSWAEYPELRYEVSNGRTLCVDCHKKTPTYGKKAR